ASTRPADGVWSRASRTGSEPAASPSQAGGGAYPVCARAACTSSGRSPAEAALKAGGWCFACPRASRGPGTGEPTTGPVEYNSCIGDPYSRDGAETGQRGESGPGPNGYDWNIARNRGPVASQPMGEPRRTEHRDRP